MPLPSEFPYAGRVTSAVLTTGTGSVPFWVRPDTYRESFGTDQQGSVAAINLICHGADAADFIKYILGFTDPSSGTYYARTLPYQSPYNPSLWASDLKLVGSGNESDSDAGWPEWSWHEYQLAFTDRPYAVVSNADLTSGSRFEHDRYVAVTTLPQAREQFVPQWRLEVESGGEGTSRIQLTEPGFRPDYSEEVEIIQYDLPCKSYPYDFAAEAIDKVNESAITFNALQGPRTFAEQTLLYRGVGEQLTPYRLRNGELAYRPRHRFGYRKQGWNKNRRADGTFGRVFVRGTSTRPYQTVNLYFLFRAAG